jgi:hypothetical protein
LQSAYCLTSNFESSLNHFKNDSAHHFHNHKITRQGFAFVIYSNLIIPILFNILPAIVILILNTILWLFMKRYTSQTNRLMTGSRRIINSQLSSRVNQTVKTTTTNRSRRPLNKMQKSYYFTIIVLGIWLLLTTIPYHLLFTYRWANTLHIIRFENLDSIFNNLQIISTVFYNSNHYINILIYLVFHRDFRLKFFAMLVNLFNKNGLIKISFKCLNIQNDVNQPTSTQTVSNRVFRFKKRQKL